MFCHDQLRCWEFMMCLLIGCDCYEICSWIFVPLRRHWLQMPCSPRLKKDHGQASFHCRWVDPSRWHCSRMGRIILAVATSNIGDLSSGIYTHFVIYKAIGSTVEYFIHIHTEYSIALCLVFWIGISEERRNYCWDIGLHIYGFILNINSGSYWPSPHMRVYSPQFLMSPLTKCPLTSISTSPLARLSQSIPPSGTPSPSSLPPSYSAIASSPPIEAYLSLSALQFRSWDYKSYNLLSIKNAVKKKPTKITIS